MSQIGQSYLSDSVGFTIGVVGLLAFVAWQWRRMRRQALGLASPASTSVVGRQALTAVIVLGAIWLLTTIAVFRHRSCCWRFYCWADVYGHAHRVWPPHLCHRRQP
jgi:D-xylose transport system permease protein